jgi:hypothetical protein
VGAQNSREAVIMSGDNGMSTLAERWVDAKGFGSIKYPISY